MLYPTASGTLLLACSHAVPAEGTASRQRSVLARLPHALIALQVCPDPLCRSYVQAARKPRSAAAAPEEGATAQPRAPTLREKWLQRQKENSGPTSDVVLTNNTVAYMQNDDRLYAVSHEQ